MRTNQGFSLRISSAAAGPAIGIGVYRIEHDVRICSRLACWEKLQNHWIWLWHAFWHFQLCLAPDGQRALWVI
ncbi:hypothetical protein M4951_16075 [Blastopirellula sp. J2-11]|uniref:hypothetical protein n=1 Tax=Blastopirellula sp. J2-11 TaxID=2943192 RepID=UPI0021C93948|nr:hypothetical protein [Blastopirellula sp. J2-11]UUO04900.1 hypothetical protein M4951_16075 [Blastopirellula sp. J2-11]